MEWLAWSSSVLCQLSESGLMEIRSRIVTLSNVGLDVPLISSKIFRDQASTPWLSHKNGHYGFVWYLANGCTYKE
jgi:hypothetical protein